MSNQDKKQALFSLAASFGEALSTTLAPLAQREWLLKVVESTKGVGHEGAACFRLTVNGSLKGTLFAVFTEAEVLEILSAVERKPVAQVGQEELDALERIVTAAAEVLSGNLAADWKQIQLQVEQAQDLAFGDLQAIVLAGGDNATAQVQVYCDAQLQGALAAGPGSAAADRGADLAAQQRNLRLVMDVELSVSLRFGQRKLQLREVLDLSSGSIVELDRMVDEPVELFLGDKLIARGEAVVVDGNYGLRVTEIPQPLASHFLN